MGKATGPEEELLAMEGVFYFVRWEGGEPILRKNPTWQRKLSKKEEDCILQHARNERNAQQPRKAATAAAAAAPKAQASSKGPASSKQAPASKGVVLQTQDCMLG